MTLTIWLAFLLFIAILVAIDVGVTRRRPRVVTPAEASLSTALYALAAVATAFLLARAYAENFLGFGKDFGRPLHPGDVWTQFLTAYAVEIALSFDNVAIFAIVFDYFGVRPAQRHRMLFWAILACLIVRAGFIALVGEVLHVWWMVYVFATLIALAMVRTLIMPDEESDLERRWVIRLIMRIPWRGRLARPVEGGGEPAREGGHGGSAVPAVAVILAAIVADVTFAADSIPAVFSVTKDPVLALASNAMAVLALRSLYFALSGVISRLRFLKVAITVLLFTLATKMYLNRYDLKATLFTMVATVGIFGIALLVSVVRKRRAEARPTPLEDLTEAVAASRRNLKKVVILIVGTAIIVFGIIIAPLPGPGPIILVPVGLGILATEFVWAKRLLDEFKSRSNALQEKAETLSKRTPIWLVPVVVAAFWTLAVVMAHHGPIKPPWKVYVIAGGMFIPVAYWGYRSIVAWRGSKAPPPGPPAPPPTTPGSVG